MEPNSKIHYECKVLSDLPHNKFESENVLNKHIQWHYHDLFKLNLIQKPDYEIQEPKTLSKYKNVDQNPHIKSLHSRSYLINRTNKKKLNLRKEKKMIKINLTKFFLIFNLETPF